MMSPQASVIIPTFNSAHFLRAAVDSALGQRNVKTEVIVIDDGSEDETWRILESYGNRITRHQVDHGGPYVARNLGASLATAPWLAFLDSDDEWLPEKLATQLARADQNTALVYTNCRNMGDARLFKPLQSDSTRLCEGQVFEDLLLRNFISHSSVLIRRDWFQRLGGYATNRRGAQDWDLWLRLAAAGGEVRLCRDPLTLYRHHSGQMTKQLDDRLGDRLAVLNHALALPAAQGIGWAAVRRSQANQWSIGAWNAAECNPAQALRWYLKCASLWPFDVDIYKQIVKCGLRSLGLFPSRPGESPQAPAANQARAN